MRCVRLAVEGKLKEKVRCAVGFHSDETDREVVAVLDKLKRAGEGGGEGDWWRGRTRDGRTGWFPRTFVVE